MYLKKYFTAMLPPFTNYKVQHTNYYFTLQHTPCHHGRPPWFPHVFLLNEATTDPDGVGRAKGQWMVGIVKIA